MRKRGDVKAYICVCTQQTKNEKEIEWKLGWFRSFVYVSWDFVAIICAKWMNEWLCQRFSNACGFLCRLIYVCVWESVYACVFVLGNFRLFSHSKPFSVLFPFQNWNRFIQMFLLTSHHRTAIHFIRFFVRLHSTPINSCINFVLRYILSRFCLANNIFSCHGNAFCYTHTHSHIVCLYNIWNPISANIQWAKALFLSVTGAAASATATFVKAHNKYLTNWKQQ